MLRRRITLIALGTTLALLLAPGLASAEDDVGSAVGQTAPEITAKTWLNTEDGASPLDGDLDPKLIVIEFWGTWCGPCVRSMPKVQKLWERYRPHGVLIVAMTRESADEVRAYLDDNAYTMPVGCDPDQTCIKEYGVQGWPSTALIDRDGEIVWRGSPYGAESQIEKALGLESSPMTLLSQCLDQGAAKDKVALRATLERLLAKAPQDFELKGWAEDQLGGAPEIEEAPKPLAAKAALKLLDQLKKGWGTEEKRQELLTRVALAADEPVDLREWVRAWYVKAYPFKSAELKQLLGERKYDTILDMFLDREPSGSLYKLAAKDDGLVGLCRKKADDAKVYARKALMALTYMMSDEPPPEDMDWEAFSSDLSVSGMSQDKDGKIVGVLIAGESVLKWTAPTYVRRQLGRHFLMKALPKGKALKAKKLVAEIDEERDRILKELRRKYGG